MIGVSATYLVDTNTLTQLRRHRRASKFFQENVKIPGDVLREADQFPDIDEFVQLEYPVTPSVLRRVAQVMASVDTNDTKLVDLYANQGGADPLVIACALDALDQESHCLDPQEWVIVTGDHAVRRTAEAFGLQVLGNAEFASLIDAQAKPGTS